MNTIKKNLEFVRNLSRSSKIVATLVLVALILFVMRLGSNPALPATTSSYETHVSLASVASFSGQAGSLPVTGKVVSVNKASILAVSSGEIVSLSHVLGDQVVAGEVIANFENSSQRAAVLQAQGAYDSARVLYTKASGSTAENSGTASSQATQSAQDAKTVALLAMQSSVASLDDALHTKADSLFSNPRVQPQLNLTVSDSQLVSDIENERVALGNLSKTANALLKNTTQANLNANITEMISMAQTVEAFLTNMVTALNKTVTSPSVPASVIVTDQVLIAAARSETIAAISSLTNAKSSYSAALSNATIASNSANAGTMNDIASAQATIKSALGALDAAKANLEKTIVRAPISGTIISLPVSRGDYVPSFTQVAQISNPGTLQVLVYVTAEDAKIIAVGEKAVINNKTNGVITFVAPALDPTTGKIQVKIGIPGDQSALTDGDTVSVSLVLPKVDITKTEARKEGSYFIIPIVAAKITPDGPVVFTVSSSTLVANPITFGAISGAQVRVLSGVTADMEIVSDARGLSGGQKIMVDLPK
ncbi:hypothetical protein AUJ77_03285 [Candidatus Nomurabacteria bacterium CG1_02_43_90]|uniref:Uncharacterized protein n=1 Tax=Candidatus Nomurabacteria bacterium CG1_02_43_90 TaxID=1805281 RepID=A0A1J4V733_9BACT|nr:MAG: hypothetical protein AUJ77_03285 [Candidatus Nomurabacteria bacterium CG1_02_43_90]